MEYVIRKSEEPLLDFFEQLAEAGIEAYPIQEKAILEWGACDGGVMVMVPTGSGKTLIAEAAIFEALCKGQKVYYTTPLVALTEQKFREFAERFGEQRVGMVTGNKQINANAPLIVAVAEILANRMLVPSDAAEKHVADVVVFDEFHYFSDRDRGWVWESSVLLLPSACKLMMLSATVSKTVPFIAWLDRERKRKHKLVESNERRVPLTYVWCEQLLPEAVATIIERNQAPCLIFAFDRVGCFATANQMTSLPTGALLSEDEQKELQLALSEVSFNRGAGRRFRKLLFKGIGVHHAGVLPKWRQIVEDLFTRKLLKFVVCTETLAAGVNLPARSVMLPEMVKYSGGSKKQILPAATAQQIFGRAGRPQFDDKGFVYVLAPPDEVKIKKWEEKIKKLNRVPTTKELSKKPRRDENLVRWNNDQFRKLREAEPAPLESQALPGYGALVFLLQEHELTDILALVNRKFAPPPMVRSAVEQVAIMLANLEALDYIETETPPGEDGTTAPMVDAALGKVDPAGRWRKLKIKSVNVDERVVTALADDFENLLDFRGVHPLFAHWLSKRMEIATIGEKVQVLESLITQAKSMCGPDVDLDLVDHGPLWEHTETRVQELLEKEVEKLREEGAFEGQDAEMVRRQRIAPVPWFLAGKLKWEFDFLLAVPEDFRLQPKDIARQLIFLDIGFFDFIEKFDLETQEGGIYRYLLRLVLLARQFGKLTGSKDYARIEYELLKVLHEIDPTFLDEWQDEHGIRLEDLEKEKGDAEIVKQKVDDLPRDGDRPDDDAADDRPLPESGDVEDDAIDGD